MKTKLQMVGIVLISALIMILSSEYDVYVHIFAIFILALGACCIVKFDFFHPYCWFSPFYFLYTCSYSILFVIGETKNYGYNKETMILQWIGLATFLMVMPSTRYRIEDRVGKRREKQGILGYVQWGLIAYLAFSILLFLRGGYAHKNEIHQSGNTLIKLAFFAESFAILISSYLMYADLECDKKLSIVKQGVIWSVILFFGFASGERDYMFRVVLIVILILFLFGKIKRSFLIACVPVGVVLLPLSSIYKYYMLTGSVSGGLQMDRILTSFLDGEFISAGRNLQILVTNNLSNHFEGESLINDFVRVFIDTGFSNQTWFNDTFFYGRRTKYGFTLIGEGYLNGGVLGVILVSTMVALMIGILYKLAFRNRYGMIAYMYMLPLFIYSNRADIANILSPFVKYVLLGIAFIWIFERITFRKEIRIAKYHVGEKILGSDS